MSAILIKEFKTYFTSMFGYVYYALFFMVTGLFFVTSCLETHSTQFGYFVLSRSFVVVILIIPLCTMRLFAQERKQKTDQLLFTAPVSTFAVLLGKYLSTAVFVLIPIILSGVYPVMISGCGKMSVRFLMGTYIAVVLVSLVLLAIGMFISAVVSNTVLAAGMTYAVYAVILLGKFFESIISLEAVSGVLHNISIYSKYYDMVSGIVRSGDVIYMLLLTAVFFLLTWYVLEGRGQSVWQMGIKMGITVFVMILLSGGCLSFTKVYDFTAEKLLSLSDQTKEVVGEVKKPTTIYYMGSQSRANATYQELLEAYHKLNGKIEIVYKNADNDSEFREKYLADYSSVNESSMLVVCDERYIYLDAADYISTVQTSTYSYKSLLNIENQLTSAIYYTNSETTDKICIISGHNEEKLENSFSNLLFLNNYNLSELNLAEKLSSLEPDFPEDCKAVMINSPQTDYSEDEIKALEEYMESGGKLFVALDPLNEDTENLFTFLKEYGLAVQKGIVIEQEQGRYMEDTAFYLIPKMKDTDFTNSLLENNMPVITMTSKGIVKGGKANGYTCVDVLTTSSKAFSKVDDFDNITTKGENDISGPFSVASYSGNPEKGSIFLLTSNVFFNEEVDTMSGGANRRFFLNIINNLAGKDTGIMVEGKDVGDQVALYPANKQTAVKILVVGILPLVIVLIGIIALMLRYQYIKIGFYKRRKSNAQE